MREYGDNMNIHFVCLETKALAKKQFSLKVVFVTQLGNSHCLTIIAFVLDLDISM